MNIRICFGAIAVVAATLAATCADGAGVFGTTFSGDATYFGPGGGGNCALDGPVPALYAGRIPVALNNPQYGNSEMCGACISGQGTGVGSGSTPVRGNFEAYVSDRCPECKSGDLDFGISGDGRWKITWKFVPCKAASMSFKFEGSNPYYYKVQIRGLSSPAVSAVIDGTRATRTMDNFFVATSSKGFAASVPIQVKTVLGQTYNAQLSLK
jgi:expansin (peptidoglycan-binding protein)